MNDLELLDTYGPDAPPPSDAALDAARARLLGAMDPATARPRPSLTRGWGIAVAGLGLAAAVAVAGVTLPRIADRPAPGVTATTGSGPIRLVAAAKPEFPWTLPGLGKASFTANPGDPVIAVYLAEDHSDVYLTSTDAPSKGEPADVGGRPGRIIEFNGTTDNGRPPLDLVWEHRPDLWLRLTGQGRYATPEALIELAGRVQDKPQRLRFEVTVGLIPDGWELAAFKDESILTYRDPADPGTDFSVQWTPKGEPLFRAREIEGMENASKVTVQGRPADLFRAGEFWMVQARLADGSIFRLMTPRSFTEEQALELAGSIRRST
ncbi:hypothetical protein Ait01nite_021830 [Actinoplanes italicus]|uniref:DUF4367 domain-containing protein n=1 Tax=Actinoplanes italicus TaxID=113567 RepID=A0A2T0KNV2_9ACTN|nr:hypothetical protein [Actinoplanes italicus]PRX25421.1 hypothetical protein CLV67_101134 [Actinoplanes italicus]GIE29138.1 hypothetical protein Ait01nite_021830 [Actinoplanes italicus]